MSLKSRRPEGDASAPSPVAVTPVVVDSGFGVSFDVVVLIAAVLSIPTILHFSAGTMPFDMAAVRWLIALGVSWLLVALVTTVIEAFRLEEMTVTEVAADHGSAPMPGRPPGVPDPGTGPPAEGKGRP